MSNQVLRAFTIEDDLASASAMSIEVRVSVEGGEDRWCFFITPEALASCGDWLPGTTARFHLGVPHMIVVTDLTAEVIRCALEEIDLQGALLRHTRPLSDR